MDFWVGDGPARRADLVTAGVTDEELYRSCARGDLARVRRGAYVRGDDHRLGDPVRRHLLAVRAVLGRLHPDAVISHGSAAAVHGLDTWGVSWDRVHATRDRRSGGRRDAVLHLHTTALDPSEVEIIDGVPVTSVARTVADLARTSTFEQAVVVADAALRTRTHRAELLVAVGRGRGRPGNPAAERVIRFADGRSANAGESRSRVCLHRAGLPAPDLQREVHDHDGRWLARVDFWWDGRPPVVGEFDGRAKYGRLLRPGQHPGEVVFDEKRREDALRDGGSRVVRWTWDDLDDFTPASQRLHRALDR